MLAITELSQPKGVKPKMSAKLEIGVNWQKGVKQMGVK